MVFQQRVTQTTQAASNSFRSLNTAIGGVAAALSAAQFNRLSKNMLDAAISTEKFRIQMALIVKDKRKVDDLINFGEKWEAKSPFTLEQVQNATVIFTKMARIRGEDLNNVKEYVQRAGEYAATFNKPLEKAVEGISKTLSGSALGLTIMRNNFQLSTKALQDLGVEFTKNGRIKDFQTQIGKVDDAMKKFIFNASGGRAVIEQSETLAGRLSTLHAETYRTFRAFGEAVAPFVMMTTNALIDLNQWIRSLDPEIIKLTGLAVILGAAFTTLVATIGPMIFFFSQIGGLFTALTASGAGAAASAGLVSAAFIPMSAVVAQIGVELTFLIELFGSIAAAIGTFASGVAGAFAAIAPAGTTFTADMLVLAGVMTPLTSGLAAMSLAIVEGISNFVTLRMAMMGVAGALVTLGLEYQKLTNMVTGANKADEAALREADDKKFKAAQERTDRLMGIGRPDKPIYTFTGDAANRGFMGDTAANALDPTAIKDYAHGQSSAQMQDDIATLKKRRDVAKKNLGDHQNADTENDAETIAAYKKQQIVQAGYSMDERMNLPVEDISKKEYDAAVARTKDRSSHNYEDTSQQVEAMTKRIKFLEARAALLGRVEHANEGKSMLSAEDAEAYLKGNKQKQSVGEKSAVDSATDINAWRQGMRDKNGKVRTGFEKLDQEAAKQQYGNTNELARQSIAAIKARQQEEEASGKISLQRKKEFLDEEIRSIQKIEKATGVHTKENVKQLQEIAKEQSKNSAEQVANQAKAEIEITRITKGEYAARLLEIKKETKERQNEGLTQLQQTTLKNQAELQAARDQANALRSLREQNEDVTTGTKASKDARVLDMAEYKYSKGKGSAADVLNSMKAQRADELSKAKRDTDRENTRLQDEIAGGGLSADEVKLRRGRMKANTAAGAESAAGINQAYDKREADFSAGDASKESGKLQNRLSLRVKELELASQLLATEQENGKNVQVQITDNIQKRMEAELALLKAKADADMVDKDAGQIAQIKADLALDELTTGKKYLDILKQQQKTQADMALAKKMEQDRGFFTTGTMTLGESQAQDKARSDADRNKFHARNQAERDKITNMRNQNILGMSGVNLNPQSQIDALNKGALSVKDESGKDSQYIWIKIEDPSGKTTKYKAERKPTGTDIKNANPKNSQVNNRGDQAVGGTYQF